MNRYDNERNEIVALRHCKRQTKTDYEREEKNSVLNDE